MACDPLNQWPNEPLKKQKQEQHLEVQHGPESHSSNCVDNFKNTCLTLFFWFDNFPRHGQATVNKEIFHQGASHSDFARASHLLCLQKRLLQMQCRESNNSNTFVFLRIERNEKLRIKILSFSSAGPVRICCFKATF